MLVILPQLLLVAPHPGAWIEIGHGIVGRDREQVAPHPGAWIEIAKS